MQTIPRLYNRFTARLERLLNRGLPPERRLSLHVRWPLYLLPLILFSQLVTPHPVWMMLLVMLVLLYPLAYYWVRTQAQSVHLTRTRQGTILVAGDSFTEEFELRNDRTLPVLWAEFVDASDLPGYDPSRVVGVAGGSAFRWKTDVACERRGLYRLGPCHLAMGDPFGLFSAQIDFDESDALLIYPRVAKLPELALPRGNASGSDRRRRALQGVQPAASVRDYQYGDSLRHIHWPKSAHRGGLTVKELELEPSGDVWIVLDLHAASHSGAGAQSTLEFCVVIAASLTAALLESGDQRAVGLLAVSGSEQAERDLDASALAEQTLLLPPQAGRAQLWNVLSALAPVKPCDVSLAQLLHQSGPALGRRRSLVVITAQTGRLPNAEDGDGQDPSFGDDGLVDWTAELLHLQASGLYSSVFLILPHDGPPEAPTPLRALLASLDIPVSSLSVDVSLPPLITYRRTRTVTRSTPTGGVVVREVVEEVG